MIHLYRTIPHQSFIFTYCFQSFHCSSKTNNLRHKMICERHCFNKENEAENVFFCWQHSFKICVILILIGISKWWSSCRQSWYNRNAEGEFYFLQSKYLFFCSRLVRVEARFFWLWKVRTQVSFVLPLWLVHGSMQKAINP